MKNKKMIGALIAFTMVIASLGIMLSIAPPAEAADPWSPGAATFGDTVGGKADRAWIMNANRGVSPGTTVFVGLPSGDYAIYHDTSGHFSTTPVDGDTACVMAEYSTGVEGSTYVGYVASTSKLMTPWSDPFMVDDCGYHRIPTPTYVDSDYSSYITIAWDVQTDCD